MDSPLLQATPIEELIHHPDFVRLERHRSTIEDDWWELTFRSKATTGGYLGIDDRPVPFDYYPVYKRVEAPAALKIV